MASQSKNNSADQNVSKVSEENPKPSDAKALEAAKSLRQNSTRITGLGHSVWLMSQSPLHKHMMMTDIEWLVLPPILLGQFRLWQANGIPMGFASWAYLGEEAAERIVQKGIRRLMPTDWKSGEDLWLIDFVAPNGGQDKMIAELKAKIFKGRKFKSLQPSQNGETEVKEW